MSPTAKPILDSLRNRELGGITFVHGYVQFLFDGSLLNAYTLPKIITPKVTINSTNQGYGDALYGLIGKVVTRTHEELEQSLTIHFNNATIIEISLKAEDRVCAEAVMLQVDGGKRWNVW